MVTPPGDRPSGVPGVRRYHPPTGRSFGSEIRCPEAKHGVFEISAHGEASLTPEGFRPSRPWAGRPSTAGQTPARGGNRDYQVPFTFAGNIDNLTNGIQAIGTVTGNSVSGNGFIGIVVGQGSTVIGNTATNNGESGISVTCPSNVTDNTAVNNGTNLVLNGTGCNDTNNVAP